MEFSKEIIKRFEDKIIPEPNTGCWLWIGSLNNQGYGMFRARSQEIECMQKAHRISYLLYKGPIPKNDSTYHGWCVCHKCDNRWCVNPDHLFLGTHQDNMDDKEKKGRGHVNPKGIAHHKNKLTEAQVLSIRVDKRSPLVIGKEYGISRRTVWAIRTKKNWTHLP